MSWSHAVIGDVVRFARSSIAPEEIADGTTYVGLEHIDSSGEFVKVTAVDAGELASSKFRFTRQHILFGKLRPYLRKTARPNFGGVCSTDILPLEPTKNIDRDYLFHVLRRQSFVDEVSSLCAGANLPRISPKVLASMQIPVPPLAEQRHIAAILDKADALCVKRREAIAKLDRLLQSVFVDMFGDPVANPKGWVEGSIEIVTSGGDGLRCGPFGTQLKVHELVDVGVPLWGIENVQNNSFVSQASKFVTFEKAVQLKAFGTRSGDVLVTRMGTIGRACVIPEGAPEGCISYHLFRVRPDPEKCLPEFLASTICRSGTFMAQLRRLARGAIMAGLNTGLLREVKFLLPPIDLQQKYLDFVRAVDRVAEKSHKSARDLDVQFQSLQQAAFSGGL